MAVSSSHTSMHTNMHTLPLCRTMRRAERRHCLESDTADDGARYRANLFFGPICLNRAAQGIEACQLQPALSPAAQTCAICPYLLAATGPPLSCRIVVTVRSLRRFVQAALLVARRSTRRQPSVSTDPTNATISFTLHHISISHIDKTTRALYPPPLASRFP